MLPKAEVKAEFVGYDGENRQSKTHRFVMWGLLFLNPGSVAGHLGSIAVVMSGFCENSSAKNEERNCKAFLAWA